MGISAKPKRLSHINDLIEPLVSGKRLLDIGSIGHHFEARQKMGTFYFSTFAKSAGYIKGIDILADDVQRARAQGYNVVVGDAENYVDREKFDVIFAGELIEHLSNPGNFLRTCKLNLDTSGAIVITTPNAFALSRLFRCALGFTNEPPVNDEHTCYYTPKTLEQLVEREDLLIKEIYYSDYDYGYCGMPPMKRFSLKLNKFLSNILPQFSQSFVAVIKHS